MDGRAEKAVFVQRDVVLVLNAIRTPWLALTPVAEAFRLKYGPDARLLGYAAIWIVGAGEGFTERLDT